MRRGISWGMVIVMAPILVVASPNYACKKTTREDEDIVARWLITVADDFIVDVYHNGERVPDARRELLDERFGATVEKIQTTVRRGDWIVFNVVNNRIRWGGAYYFGVSGMLDVNEAGFTSSSDSPDWSYCDNPNNVHRFISERSYLSSHRVLKVDRPWHEGDVYMKRYAGQWTGTSVWGSNRNTWIKFIAR